jgi:transcriptional regulator with XRE-family HTH domain
LEKSLGSKRQKALISLIVEKRKAAGLTQTQLAERLGEYQSFVARLESGQRRLDVLELIKIAETLRFDPASLVRRISKLSS